MSVLNLNKCPTCDVKEGTEHKDECIIMKENIRRHGLGIACLNYQESIELVINDFKES